MRWTVSEPPSLVSGLGGLAASFGCSEPELVDCSAVESSGSERPEGESVVSGFCTTPASSTSFFSSCLRKIFCSRFQPRSSGVSVGWGACCGVGAAGLGSGRVAGAGPGARATIPESRCEAAAGGAGGAGACSAISPQSGAAGAGSCEANAAAGGLPRTWPTGRLFSGGSRVALEIGREAAPESCRCDRCTGAR